MSMKKLYLIRHAKSSWEDHIHSDYERPLSGRGKRDAPLIGEVLSKKNILPDIIISSSAKRALRTAYLIADKLNYSRERIVENSTIYEATTQNLLDVINNIEESNNSAMLFGHNPGFTTLANLIGDRFVDNMPTCAVAILELDIKSWKDVNVNCGKLIGFEYPKKYSV